MTLTKLAIDTADELVDDSAQILILLNVLTTRHGDLHKHHLANLVRVFVQKDLEGVQLLRHALDVVEPVHADDQLHALKLALELGNALLHLGLLQALVELLRVDADGKRADADHLALELDPVRRRLEAEDARAAAKEVARVVVSVEADEVAVQGAEEQLVAHGQDAVDLAAREGRVQEEADLDIGLVGANLLAQHGGQQHEVVIVHPN